MNKELYIALVIFALKSILFNKTPKDANKKALLDRILRQYPFVRDIANETNVPLNILVSIIAVESSGNQDATGSIGEAGLMQLTFGAVETVNSFFGTYYSIFDMNNALSNVKIGAYYLKYLYSQHKSWKTTIGFYNAKTESKRLAYYKKVKSYMDNF